MTTLKEIVIVKGTLRKEGRERSCRVRATKKSFMSNESSSPIRAARLLTVTTTRTAYEVEFDGQRELLTKKNGHYLAWQ